MVQPSSAARCRDSRIGAPMYTVLIVLGMCLCLAAWNTRKPDME